MSDCGDIVELIELLDEVSKELEVEGYDGPLEVLTPEQLESEKELVELLAEVSKELEEERKLEQEKERKKRNVALKNAAKMIHGEKMLKNEKMEDPPGKSKVTFAEVSTRVVRLPNKTKLGAPQTGIGKQDMMQLNDYDHVFRVLLIGDPGVGKTSLLRQFTDGVFSTFNIPTTNFDYRSKLLKVQGLKIKLQFWDTFMNFQNYPHADSYFSCADVFLFVYDVTNPASYATIVNWITDVQRFESTVKLVFGNKSDLQLQNQFQPNNDLPHYLVSAKSNVADYFLDLAKICLTKKLTSR